MTKIKLILRCIDEGEEGVDYEDEAFFTLADGFEFAYRVSAHENCPRTLKEALASPEADKWFDAAKKEVEALLREGTWKLAKLPQGRKAIGCRWVICDQV